MPSVIVIVPRVLDSFSGHPENDSNIPVNCMEFQKEEMKDGERQEGLINKARLKNMQAYSLAK